MSVDDLNKLEQSNQEWIESLRDSDAQLPPPWLAISEIPRFSMGWRMGYGEYYISQWGLFYQSLSPIERKLYRDKYRNKLTWWDFYLQYSRIWWKRMISYFGFLFVMTGMIMAVPFLCIYRKLQSLHT